LGKSRSILGEIPAANGLAALQLSQRSHLRADLFCFGIAVFKFLRRPRSIPGAATCFVEL
jgi:hypothetical protein